MTIFYHNQTYESFACQCLQIINPPKKPLKQFLFFMEKAYLGLYVCLYFNVFHHNILPIFIIQLFKCLETKKRLLINVKP